MTSADAGLREQERRLQQAWQPPGGWRYWSEVNNSLVGRWYLALTLIFFLCGGVLALIMRLHLASPAHDLVSPDRYNQLFTLHGSVMMFLFAIPIFEAVSIMFLPQMLGARELPFPRLSAFGFWAFAIGGVFFCGSILFDAAPRGGWFMYPPLTSAYQPDIGADIWLLGFSFIEVAAIAAAVELIVGVLRCRPPGMRLPQIPLYGWYVLVAAFMLLFAFPPLIAGTILLELERAFGWPFFNPAGGGDPLLWQHLFWIFGHPEVYIVFLPSVALIAMMLPTLAQRPIVGYGWVVMSAVATGFLSFGLWVHHMFTTGLPTVTLALFSAASAAIAIPTAIQVFCFIATIWASRITRSVPMLFITGGLITFVMGGLTGVMLAMAPFNAHAHDTYFVVGHLHTVLIAGAIFPLLAATYYYFPLFDGYHLSPRLGRIAFWLTFIGFHITFLPMHVTGMFGLPRRVYTFPSLPTFDVLNVVSTVGAFILGAGFLVVGWDILRRKTAADRSERNPWRAGTVEWLPEMPNEPWGVRVVPRITTRYPLWDQPSLVADYDHARGYLADADNGRRELLMTSTVDAVPLACLRIPGPSFMPLIAAVAVGGVFIFATLKMYVTTGVFVVLSLAAILTWLWRGTAEIPERDTRDVGGGLHLPLYLSGRESVGWWAMGITMLAVFAAFVSLVFGYLFYWSADEAFLQRATPLSTAWVLRTCVMLAGAWGLTVVARRLNTRDWPAWTSAALIVGMLCGADLIRTVLVGASGDIPAPTTHVYEATVWLLLWWTITHVALGMVMQAYCLARRWAGRMTARHDMDLQNVTLYWHFTLVTGAITLALIAGFPEGQ